MKVDRVTAAVNNASAEYNMKIEFLSKKATKTQETFCFNFFRDKKCRKGYIIFDKDVADDILLQEAKYLARTMNAELYG